jgi:oligopeptide/dipeptide ABC transporter ATP-binding protein
MSNSVDEYQRETARSESDQLSVGDPVVELRDLTVTFDMDRGQSKVLDDVSIDVERGEILGIVGESGSGKSMLASSMLDAVVDPGVLDGDIVYHPAEGDPVNVLEFDEPGLRKFRWETISMVFQGAMSSFNPVMRVETHFRETLVAHDHDVESGMAHARELFEMLYLDPDRVLDSYPHELSGGMQQRALIALSLVLDPDVLVMDEPTAALDLLMQRSILSLLSDLQEEYDLTMVFITHDLPLVAKLADRLAVMYAFDLVEVAPTRELLSNSSHPYTRALLRATPSLDVPADEIDIIEGSSPDPVNVPSGCSYHPRCALADEQCVQADPDFRPVDRTHAVACFHWSDAEDEIPLTIENAYGGDYA